MFANPLQRMNKDRGGSVAILVAVMVTMLIGFTSLAAEVSMALATQRKMQAAADSAAISAANAQFVSTGSSSNCGSNCSEEGYAIARLDGFTSSTQSCSGNDTVYVVSPPCDGPNAGNATYVEALIKKPFTLQLAHVLFPGNFVLHGRAVAHISSTSSPPCAVALDPSGKDTITISGGTTTSFVNCGLAADSNDPNAVETKGSGSLLSVTSLLTSGSPGYNAGAGTIDAGSSGNPCSAANPSCLSSSPPALNPYTNLPSASCSGSNSIPQGNSTTASPGCYKDLKLAGGGGGCSLTLSAGTYYFSGNVTVNSGCTLTGTSGVTIVLTGSNSNVSIAGGSTVNLTAQSTGTYAGVVFYSQSSTTQSVLGSSNMTLAGSIVFPNALVKFAGNTNGTNPNTPCTTVIAWQLQFTGGSALQWGCTTASGVKPIVEPATLSE
ncbi:MAG TPA: pilus assembly protein TadG-related protein [Stellaceae bacterium]|nr:pilus assembly protein TadG-related protein [Stellaceae bacterium]